MKGEAKYKRVICYYFFALVALLLVQCDESKKKEFVKEHVAKQMAKPSLSHQRQVTVNQNRQNIRNEYQMLSNILGIGVQNWLYCFNDGAYYSLSLTPNFEALFTMPNSVTLEFLFNGISSDNCFVFSDVSDNRNMFRINLGTHRMLLMLGGNAFDFNILGPISSYSGNTIGDGAYSDGGTSINNTSTNSNSSQRKCSLCDGKGWRVGNKTPVYDMGQTYCSECDGFFPNSHSHDLCPSCQGHGYLNY